MEAVVVADTEVQLLQKKKEEETLAKKEVVEV